MKRIVCLAAAAALLVLGGVARAEETLESIETKVKEAFEKHTSYAAKITMKASLPVGENKLAVDGTGRMELMRDGDKVLWRQDIALKMPEPVPMEMKTILIFDGSELEMINEALGQKQSQRSKPEPGQGATHPGGPALFQLLKEKQELKVLPDGEVDGAPVFVLEGVLKEPNPDMPFMKAVYHLDKATGLLRRTETYESENVVAVTVTYGDIETGVTLDPARFVLSSGTPATPPPSQP